MKRLSTTLAMLLLTGIGPALAQDLPPAPALDSRAEAIDALYGQADQLIAQIKWMGAGPDRAAAVEELRGVLAQIDAAYTVEEKADHARRNIEALRGEIERQRARLKQAGIAMAQAKSAEPPDPTAVQTTGSDYTLQDAILRALEEKEKKEARQQSMGTAEALRLMQEVE